MTLKAKQAKRVLIAAFLAAGTQIAAPAAAQDKGGYAGLSYGQSKFDAPTITGASSVTTPDDKDNGFWVYGGYQFNRYIAVEAGYIDLGGFTQRGTPGPFTVQWDLSGVTAAAVGTLPVSANFSFFGKAGLIAENIGSKISGPVEVTTKNGLAAMGGVGVRYEFTKNIGVQAEWTYFGGDMTVNFLSAGVRYKF